MTIDSGIGAVAALAAVYALAWLLDWGRSKEQKTRLDQIHSRIDRLHSRIDALEAGASDRPATAPPPPPPVRWVPGPPPDYSHQRH